VVLGMLGMLGMLGIKLVTQWQSIYVFTLVFHVGLLTAECGLS